jgi:hypothetical protein
MQRWTLALLSGLIHPYWTKKRQVLFIGKQKFVEVLPLASVQSDLRMGWSSRHLRCGKAAMWLLLMSV